ncbi:unnamed protein product, partial [Heterosigma akashiwo]
QEEVEGGTVSPSPDFSLAVDGSAVASIFDLCSPLANEDPLGNSADSWPLAPL